nr:preprotein translocase subunit SECE1-like [Lolium perenne]
MCRLLSAAGEGGGAEQDDREAELANCPWVLDQHLIIQGHGQRQRAGARTATAAGGPANPAEEPPVSPEKTQEEVAAELKEVMRARKEAEVAGGGGGWWAGVTQEMSEIEWPAPGKVLGTTGVVLGIIAGSTAALLSVNAVLAELSDRVFAGRGLQDFF